MTFDQIIGHEEFDQLVAVLVLVALAESILRLGGQSTSEELILDQMERVLQRFPVLDPLRTESARQLVRRLLEHLQSLSPES